MMMTPKSPGGPPTFMVKGRPNMVSGFMTKGRGGIIRGVTLQPQGIQVARPGNGLERA